jgi:hypothetical protein
VDCDPSGKLSHHEIGKVDWWNHIPPCDDPTTVTVIIATTSGESRGSFEPDVRGDAHIIAAIRNAHDRRYEQQIRRNDQYETYNGIFPLSRVRCD